MQDDHGSIIARLMAEARIMFHQEESRKRSIRAKQAWARRREEMGPKRKPEA